MSSPNPIRILIFIVIILSWCNGGESITKRNTKTSFIPTLKELHIAIDHATQEINMVSNVEQYLADSNINVKPGSPSHGLLLDSHPTLYEMSRIRNAEIIDKASQYIIYNNCHGQKEEKCAKILSLIKLNQTSQGKECFSEYYGDTLCNGLNLKYRTADGSCNNMEHLFWGKSNTQYKRLLFPAYADSISSINILPNARILSTSLVTNEDYQEISKTIAMAIWAIFIGHDLSHTAVSSMLSQNNSIECCDDDGISYSTKYMHPSCASITIPEDDQFFSQIGRTCMNYVRSIPAMRSDCTFGPREQLNQATHYLDASMIYGSTEKQTLSLRNKSQGLLSYSSVDKLAYNFMPLTSSSDTCTLDNTCYRAGDIRANAHPYLTTMHTLWLREHNRIARKLVNINPHWDDERTFQEARKIVIAFVQHITYVEWLPLLIGSDNIAKHDLGSLSTEYSTLYDSNIDPMVSNSFATSILPFANSMISDTLCLYTESRKIQKRLSLEEFYYEPGDLQIQYLEELVRGLSMQNPHKIDMFFTDTMTNYLYSGNNDYGMDIVSLDIQRSRDHGIPSYTQFRKYCKLSSIKTIEDLSEIMVKGAASKLLQRYKKWDDIDLLIGALFEKHEADSMVGPTMRCLIVEQFNRTRRADKYFYDFPNVFKKDQLAEIRKMTLSRLFCDNSEFLSKMQKNVFIVPNISDLHLCKSSLIEIVNLTFWKEDIKLKTTTTEKSYDERYYPRYFLNGVG